MAIVESQSGWMWNAFIQPIGFITFLVSAFAETNSLPFDLPEAEPELVGGYHTEYSSMKFAAFFLAEYANMIIASYTYCYTLSWWMANSLYRNFRIIIRFSYCITSWRIFCKSWCTFIFLHLGKMEYSKI